MVTDYWAKFSAMAQAASAAGTFLAVSVALWLAQWQTKPRLKIRVALVHVLGGGMSGLGTRYLQISIANVGSLPTIVNTYGWQIGRWRPDNFFQNGSASPLSAQLPARLDAGESVMLLHETDQFEDAAGHVFAAVEKRVNWWRPVPPGYVVVWTSTQHGAKRRLPKNVVAWMRATARNADLE